MDFEPAVRGELGGDAGGEQQEADREGAEDPTGFQMSLEHEPVEQGQDKNEDRCLGEEGRAAMRGDGDQIDEG